MNATGQLWDRQQHRIAYFGDVRFSSPVGNETIVARAENLSETGVFLVTSEPCQLGQELVCELPLGSERLILRGRVAWVRSQSDSGGRGSAGMGVEFLDLCREDALILRQAVGMPMTDSLHVSVRFEGMPEPIRAEALSTSSGIYLRTSLPFLRLNSAVELHFKDERRPPQQGWLEEVTLQADEKSPVPRLQVHVAPQQEEVDAALPRLGPETAVNPAPEVAEDRTLPSVMVDESMIIEGAASEGDEPLPLVRRKHRTTPRASVELDDQLLLPKENTPYVLPQDPAERSYWDFEGIPGMDPDEEDARFWERSSPPRHRLALWMSALAMLALALASAYVTGFYGTARAAMTRWTQRAWALVDRDAAKTSSSAQKAASLSTQKAASLSTQKAASLSTQKAASLSTQKAASLSAQKAASSSAQKAASLSTQKAASSSAPPSTRGSVPAGLRSMPTPVATSTATSTATSAVASLAKTPPSPSPALVARGLEAAKVKTPTTAKIVSVPEIAIQGHEATIRLPIRGSLRGKRSYPLAHPAGVVVRLPNARSTLRYGTYPLHRGGFRLLWVKRFKKGVRFRVLFSSSKPSCRLAILKDSVRVTCAEASKLASR